MNKKRKRLNSGTSNQSKFRSVTAIGGESYSAQSFTGQYLSSRGGGGQGTQLINSDLLKRFTEDLDS
jgi:hypothetical protein